MVRKFLDDQFPNLPHDKIKEITEIASQVGGDLHQAKILAEFGAGASKDATPHVYFDTQRIINGRVSLLEPHFSLNWVSQNAPGSFTNIADYATFADACALADTRQAASWFEDEGNDWVADFVQKTLHTTGLRKHVDKMSPPARPNSDVKEIFNSVSKICCDWDKRHAWTVDGKSNRISQKRSEQLNATPARLEKSGVDALPQHPEEPQKAVEAEKIEERSEKPQEAEAVYNSLEFQIVKCAVFSWTAVGGGDIPSVGPEAKNDCRGRAIVIAECSAECFEDIMKCSGVQGCIISKFCEKVLALVFKDKNFTFRALGKCYAPCDGRLQHSVVKQIFRRFARKFATPREEAERDTFM